MPRAEEAPPSQRQLRSLAALASALDDGTTEADLRALSGPRMAALCARHASRLSDVGVQMLIEEHSALQTGDLPPGPSLPAGQRTARSEVTRHNQQGRRVWRHVAKRVCQSLPDYNVTQIERLQSRELWLRYIGWRKALRSEDNGEAEMFHFSQLGARAKPPYAQIAATNFAPQLAMGGEYGDGVYFADHAIYAVAYGQGWLCDMEQPPEDEIALVWSRVTLGNIKDFGWNCASDRRALAAEQEARDLGRDAEELAAEKESEFKSEFPQEGRAGQERHRRRPPPLDPVSGRGAALSNPRDAGTYDSVTGTEGHLLWSPTERLRNDGAKFGRQFVTFNDAQAYPEFVITLQRKPKAEADQILRDGAKSDPRARSILGGGDGGLPRSGRGSLLEPILAASLSESSQRDTVSDFANLCGEEKRLTRKKWILLGCLVVLAAALTVVGVILEHGKGPCDEHPCGSHGTCR